MNDQHSFQSDIENTQELRIHTYNYVHILLMCICQYTHISLQVVCKIFIVFITSYWIFVKSGMISTFFFRTNCSFQRSHARVFITVSMTHGIQWKAFLQKGCILLFGPIFIFQQDQTNFWQTDLFFVEQPDMPIESLSRFSRSVTTPPSPWMGCLSVTGLPPSIKFTDTHLYTWLGEAL